MTGKEFRRGGRGGGQGRGRSASNSADSILCHPELPGNIVNDMAVPVVTLPLTYYEDGTLFLLAFIGEVWTERGLLAYAYDLEQASQARVRPILA